MHETKHITIISSRKKIVLGVSSIIYIIVIGKNTQIHILGEKIYETKMSLNQLEKELGDGFIKAHRGCIVSAMAIHDITDKINLVNGETLEYTTRKKKQIIEQFHLKQKSIINSFSSSGIPETEEEYFKYYSSFDNMPFAFTDIEMVFNEEKHAVDWIFRYGNAALSKLEKLPLNELIGNSFGSLFSNMDSKWLKNYERTALYSETIEMIDFSPEIDTYLKVICFPTFKCHCGCILFNIDEIEFSQNSSEAQQALKLYLGNI
ncbi:MAG: LytTR family DNA-binding domain-containing protein [Acutalibacteraceae bacterium]